MERSGGSRTYFILVPTYAITSIPSSTFDFQNPFIMGVFLSIPVLGSTVLCLLTIYSFIIHPVYLSPLAKIPNAHFTCSVSSAWILWTRYKRRENKTVLAAHQRYGPVVRLGPKEISVCGINGGLRTVYGGGFEKKDWYQPFVNYG